MADETVEEIETPVVDYQDYLQTRVKVLKMRIHNAREIQKRAAREAVSLTGALQEAKAALDHYQSFTNSDEE